MFKPKDWLDRFFEIGIIGKGLNGAAELIGGVLLSVVNPLSLQRWARDLTESELSQDPHDVFALYVLHTANGLTGHAVLFGAVYLLAHGAVKVILVTALLLDKVWAYPWMIAVLVCFIVYQLYRIFLDHSIALMALTAFDIVIAILTWREYGRHREGKRRRKFLPARRQAVRDD